MGTPSAVEPPPPSPHHLAGTAATAPSGSGSLLGRLLSVDNTALPSCSLGNSYNPLLQLPRSPGATGGTCGASMVVSYYEGSGSAAVGYEPATAVGFSPRP